MAVSWENPGKETGKRALVLAEDVAMPDNKRLKPDKGQKSNCLRSTGDKPVQVLPFFKTYFRTFAP